MRAYWTENSLSILKCISPLWVTLCIIIQIFCVFTNKWLYSEELMPNLEYVKFNMSVDEEFKSKFTVSGLWVICQNEPGNTTMVCSEIEYLTGEEYQPDPNDSTGAIPYAAKRAAIFMMISSSFMVFGSILTLRDFIFLIHLIYRITLRVLCCKSPFNCFSSSSSLSPVSSPSSSSSSNSSNQDVNKPYHDKCSVVSFISGICFILSGLMILAAMVVYISTFKAEVGNKLRPKSSFQGPLFNYKYGSSFYFSVCGLIICEVTGTLLIFLYIKSHQVEWKSELLAATIHAAQNSCLVHSSKLNLHLNQDNNQSLSPQLSPPIITIQSQDSQDQNPILTPHMSQINNSAAAMTNSPSLELSQNLLQIPNSSLNPNLNPGLGGLETGIVHCRKHQKGRRYSRTCDVLAASPRGSITLQHPMVLFLDKNQSLNFVESPPGGHSSPMVRFPRDSTCSTNLEEIPPPPPPPAVSVTKSRRGFLSRSASFNHGQDYDPDQDNEDNDDGDNDQLSDNEESRSCFDNKGRKKKKKKRRSSSSNSGKKNKNNITKTTPV